MSDIANNNPPAPAPFSDTAIAQADSHWMALYKPPENATGEEIARGRDKWMERIKESRAGATASAAAGQGGIPSRCASA